MMAEAKTRASDASIEACLAARASPAQRADSTALMAMLARLTGEAPRMWGPSIIGYGRYGYKYDSGRTGESCLAGFAIRGREFVVYLSAEGDDQPALLAALGKHKIGKSCLYFKQLADLDMGILEQLVADSIAELHRRYPPGPA